MDKMLGYTGDGVARSHQAFEGDPVTVTVTVPAPVLLFLLINVDNLYWPASSILCDLFWFRTTCHIF
jgi:hypothetical protein